VLSQTLDSGLKAYGIGPKIRALRLKKSMGLVALGRHSGLSPALLSKLERGKIYPTLPTLLRIALVFSVGLDYFFETGRAKPIVAVVRRKDRLRLPDSPSGSPAFYFESLDFPVPERRLNGYFAKFVDSPAGKPRAHAHAGAELIYMLHGSLVVSVADEEYVLGPGDSMYFDSGAPHTYRRQDSRPCSALVVVSEGAAIPPASRPAPSSPPRRS
jgi:transcriptional regulator with XRE-family HTH domain